MRWNFIVVLVVMLCIQHSMQLSPVVSKVVGKANVPLPSDSSMLKSEGSSRNSAVSKRKVSRRRKLFSSFAYKGITLSFAKSVIELQGGQVGFKIPVTPNFPVYDSKVYLPRITGFVGIAFPLHLKMSISVTVHLIALLHGLKLLRRMGMRHLPKLDKLKPANSGNSASDIKRVGFNINFKLDRKRGFRYNIGPALAYLPSYAFVLKVVPWLLILPTVLFSVANALVQVLEILDTILSSYERPSLSESDNPDKLYDGNEYLSKIHQERVRKIEAKRKNSLRSRLLLNAPRGIEGLIWTYQSISKWMVTKKPSLQYSLGYYFSPVDTSKSSNIVFDLQPFYPFATQWNTLLAAVSAALLPEQTNEIDSEDTKEEL